jgi:hypothetical protein
MSHLTTIKTEIKDQDILHETLKGLGFSVAEGGTIQSMGSAKPVDFGITFKRGLKIGFSRTSPVGAYEIVSMWETLEKKEIKTLIDKIYQEYARRKVLKETQRKGFSLIFQQKTETGDIRLILKKLAVGGL